MKGQSLFVAACAIVGVLGAPFVVDSHNPKVKVVTVIEKVVVTKTCTVNAQPSPHNYVSPPIVPASNPVPEYKPKSKIEKERKVPEPSKLHYDAPAQPKPKVPSPPPVIHQPVYVPPPPPVKPKSQPRPKPDPPAAPAYVPPPPLPAPVLPPPPPPPTVSPPTEKAHVPALRQAEIPKPVTYPVHKPKVPKPVAPVKPEPPAKPAHPVIPAKPHSVALWSKPLFDYSSEDGEATFYDPGLGSCGEISYPTDMHVAFPAGLMQLHENGNPNKNPLCGLPVELTRNGITIRVYIKDKCRGCKTNTLDLTPIAFNKIAKPAEGRVKISWRLVGTNYKG